MNTFVVGIDASRANKPIRTGTEWYSYYLIEELKKIIPADVHVHLYSREPLQGDLAVLPANWEAHELKWAPKYLWTLLRLSWEMWRRPVEVLFIPAHGLPLVLPRATVTTIHDIGFDRYPKLYKWYQVWYHRLAVRLAVARATRIITISEFTRGEIEERYGPVRPPIDVIPLAYDAAAFVHPVPAIDIARVKQRYFLNKPYFFYIGRLEHKKNITRILESFAAFRQKHPEGQLVLIGPWGHGREDFMALMHQLALGESVPLLKWVPASDVPPLMAGARALLFPTLYEGFGLPILEAMAVGTPVITSNRGANQEVAGGAALLVDPENVNDITQAMETIFTDAVLASRLREEGLRHSVRYRWAHTAQATWHSLQIARHN